MRRKMQTPSRSTRKYSCTPREQPSARAHTQHERSGTRGQRQAHERRSAPHGASRYRYTCAREALYSQSERLSSRRGMTGTRATFMGTPRALKTMSSAPEVSIDCSDSSKGFSLIARLLRLACRAASRSTLDWRAWRNASRLLADLRSCDGAFSPSAATAIETSCMAVLSMTRCVVTQSSVAWSVRLKGDDVSCTRCRLVRCQRNDFVCKLMQNLVHGNLCRVETAKPPTRSRDARRSPPPEAECSNLHAVLWPCTMLVS